MKFEEWLSQNENRQYVDMMCEYFKFDDEPAFRAWAYSQRLDQYSMDWAMLMLSVLHDRISVLEAKLKDKK